MRVGPAAPNKTEWPTEKKAIDIRQLLRRFVEVHAHHRADATVLLRDGLVSSDAGVLSTASCALRRRCRHDAIMRVHSGRQPRAKTRRTFARQSSASSRAAGMLVPKCRPRDRVCWGLRRACGRRWHGTGRHRADLYERLASAPATRSSSPPLSAAYTALAVMMAGARPVFADIDPERLTIDPAAVEAAVTLADPRDSPGASLRSAADMSAQVRIAERHNLALVEDARQAHLSTSQGRLVGTIGVAGAFSFYPTKNLGALGDGGAIVTGDGALAARLRRLRNGGPDQSLPSPGARPQFAARRNAGRHPSRACHAASLDRSPKDGGG